MSELFDEYMKLALKASRLFFDGQEKKADLIYKKIKKEIYPRFTAEDWDELIRHAAPVQGKIAMDRLKKEYLGKHTAEKKS